MKVGVKTCKESLNNHIQCRSDQCNVVQAFKAVILNEICWKIKQVTVCQVNDNGATLR